MIGLIPYFEIGAGECMLLGNFLGSASAIPCAGTRPPAHAGIVVVGAGVDGKFAAIIVGTERRALRILAEGELQDGHSGEAKSLADGLDFRSDHAQILSDNREVAEFLFESREEVGTGTLDPASVDRGCLVGWDFPVSFKSSEVVDANRVV